MSFQDIHTLPKGARFVGPDKRTHYEVTTPASTHPNGSVEVRNLSMTNEQAAELLATPGAVEVGCDPRDGVFAFTSPTPVQVIDGAAAR